VSSLDRTSANPYGEASLASSADTSGTSDKRPVLAQHAGQGALCVDHECFTQAWTRYAWNPATRDWEGTHRRTVSRRANRSA